MKRRIFIASAVSATFAASAIHAYKTHFSPVSYNDVLNVLDKQGLKIGSINIGDRGFIHQKNAILNQYKSDPLVNFGGVLVPRSLID